MRVVGGKQRRHRVSSEPVVTRGDERVQIDEIRATGTLSPGDKRGLQLLYPAVGGGLEAVMTRRQELRRTVERAAAPDSRGLEAAAAARTLAKAASRTLRWLLR